MQEVDSRFVPVGRDEIEWAHSRPSRHRVPVPKAGDQVLYRHDPWGEVSEAEVLAVQPLDDLSDPLLAFVERDQFGELILIDDRPVIALKKDPWPTVTLRTRYGVGVTREARLRGSPGWLPLDWETRYRPLPGFLSVHQVTEVAGGNPS